MIPSAFLGTCLMRPKGTDFKIDYMYLNMKFDEFFKNSRCPLDPFGCQDVVENLLTEQNRRGL